MVNLQVTVREKVRVRPIRLALPRPGTVRRKLGLRRMDYNEASYQAFEDEATSGYLQDSEGDGEEVEDYELSALRNSGSPQKLDMLYSCSWQHMPPSVKPEAKARASPRKARAKERAR